MARAAILTKKAPPAPAPAATRVRRQIITPPAPEPEPEIEEEPEDVDVYGALFAAAVSINSGFKGKHEKENAQQFLKRLAGTIAQLTDDDFHAMPEAGQIWHVNAVTAINEETPLPPIPGTEETATAPVKATRTRKPKVVAPPEPEPEVEDDDADADADDEFDDEDGEFDAEDEEEEAEPEPEPAKKVRGQGLIDFRARKAAEKLAAAGVPTAAPVKATKAAAAVAPTKPAKAPPAPVKAAKAAPAPVAKADKPLGGVEAIRRYVLDTPEVTTEEIFTYLNSIGLSDVSPGTVAVTKGQTLSAINYLKSQERWVDLED